MADEVKNDEQTADQTGGGAGNAPAPKRKIKKKWAITGGVVAVIVVIACGVWVWHGTPGFCGTVCHDSMDPYVQTYEAQPNSQAVDKWGNDVSNSNAMMASLHAQKGVTCLDCHTPDISQQLGEVQETISGDYYVPLEEVDVLSLRENSNLGSDSGRGDEFCMNDKCHSDLNRDKLKEETSNLPFNPHAWQHEQNKCSDCHKSHRASVLMCTQCHSEAEQIMPDGWVDANTSKQIEQSIYK